MRRMTMIAAAVIVLLALAAPAYAGFRLVSDSFDRATGTGTAVMELGHQIWLAVVLR
jgi:hypothetical protein